MNQTLKRVITLIEQNEVKISNHGYDELAEDGLLVKEIISSVKLWRNILNTQRDHVSLYYKKIKKEIQCM